LWWGFKGGVVDVRANGLDMDDGLMGLKLIEWIDRGFISYYMVVCSWDLKLILLWI
jgi:hypothetical protein